MWGVICYMGRSISYGVLHFYMGVVDRGCIICYMGVFYVGVCYMGCNLHGRAFVYCV